MEDSAFVKLFSKDESEAPRLRNQPQHAIHQNAEMTIQISIVGFILQEVTADVINQICEAVSDTYVA